MPLFMFRSPPLAYLRHVILDYNRTFQQNPVNAMAAKCSLATPEVDWVNWFLDAAVEPHHRTKHRVEAT
jgi:hypothetical protein